MHRGHGRTSRASSQIWRQHCSVPFLVINNSIPLLEEVLMKIIVQFIIVSAVIAAPSHVLGSDNGTSKAATKTHAKTDGERRATGVLSETKLVWDGPKMRAIEQKWLREGVPPGTDRRAVYDLMVENLVGLVRKELSKEDLHELAISTETMPVSANDLNGFAQSLLQALVITFADDGDRGGLVKLLSRRCPHRVLMSYDIEFYLQHYTGKKIEDPILILNDAYERCKVTETRHEIAQAFHRAFRGSGIQGNDDNEIIRNATQWYKENKKQLTTNDDYSDNAKFPIFSKYRNNPLFIERPVEAPGGAVPQRKKAEKGEAIKD